MSNKLKYCKNCLGNDITSKELEVSPKHPLISPKGRPYLSQYYYTIYKGFVRTYTEVGDNSICPTCKQPLTEMNLTEEEWFVLHAVSLEQDFVFAMDKLKKDDIIEFTTKMTQFNELHRQWYKNRLNISQSQQSNTPKCPTCGSTNIKKISGTRRWIGVGLFGIASSDVGKTRECNDCGYKW